MSLKHILPNKVLLSRLLALTLLLASVAVTSHVHEEAEAGNEQVEDCFTYHQFQSHDQALPSFAELFQANETHTKVAFLSANTKTNSLLPPARGPPSVS